MSKLGPYEVNTIIVGDCLQVLRQVPDGMFQMAATSPPYWGLRDYGIPPVVWGGDPLCEHGWGAQHEAAGSRSCDSFPGKLQRPGNTDRDRRQTSQFCHRCGAWLGSLGLEPTPELYVEHIVEVFREVRRVLRDDGQCFINISDTRSKDRQWVGIPWRLVFALQADGWRWEDEIIWEKPNCMPSSQRNRCTRSHEIILQMNKSRKAFFDQDAIREPIAQSTANDHRLGWYEAGRPERDYPAERPDRGGGLLQPNPAGRNKRTVWTIPTHPFPQAHFATFPPKLVEPMIKAGTSERGACPECGKAWVRVTEPSEDYAKLLGKSYHDHSHDLAEGMSQEKVMPRVTADYRTIGWRPACSCNAGDPIPCIVLDPFAGAGTALMVADGLKRDWFGIEIGAPYVEMALERIAGDRKKRAQLEMEFV